MAHEMAERVLSGGEGGGAEGARPEARGEGRFGITDGKEGCGDRMGLRSTHGEALACELIHEEGKAIREEKERRGKERPTCE